MPAPEFTGVTWEDLALYVKRLREHIALLNSDRQATNAYCSTNSERVTGE